MTPKSSEEWVAEYSQSHQHPVNRLLHSFGIPMIVLGIALFVAARRRAPTVAQH